MEWFPMHSIRLAHIHVLINVGAAWVTDLKSLHARSEKFTYYSSLEPCIVHMTTKQILVNSLTLVYKIHSPQCQLLV